jgi:PhnB protein
MSAKKVFTAEQAREIGNTLGIDWGRFDVEQFRMGLDVELEHGRHDPATNVTGDDAVTTGKIALAHLKEFPDYYTRLARMEREADEEGAAAAVTSRAWKPSSYTSVAPYLITEKAGLVIDFLREALGAEPLRRFDMPDGSIMHAEARIDDTVVMVGQAGGDWPAVRSHVHVYVRDVDASYARALQAGGVSVQAPSGRAGDPDRRGGVRDPGGNTWWLATQVA